MKNLKKFHEYLIGKSSRKLILSTFFLFALSTGSICAQDLISFGLKGGLNYNANGEYFSSITENSENPDRNIGYHIGVFGKFGKSIYVRPELMYTKTKSDYDSGEFDMKKIDAPILVGVKVIGPLSVFGGPAFQYILDSEFDGISVNNIENDFSVGLNFGLALNLNKIGIDLRYERGFSDNEANFLDNNDINISRLDTRPDQLILSLSVTL